MCGITGLFDLTGKRNFDATLLDRMNETQHHRGPDESGSLLEPGIALGHKRLSIIDISSGQQPMTSADGNLSVVYNGEIYNFRDIARTLEGRGYRFHTHCDTEVILYAWAEWGENCVEHFRGMFAFALYDRNRQCLFLARDRLGIKPLYYAALPGGVFIFGSELKALKAHPDLRRQMDYRSVEDYFALGYIPEPRTIYQDAYKLSPGHSLLLKRGSPVPETREYWDIPFNVQTSVTEESLAAELVERFREAVRLRLIAEVPLGAFLSGGVDSSAVVSMMSELNSSPVNTCAIGFDVKQFNETQFAHQVASLYKTDHFERQVDSDDFNLLGTLAGLYDEPYADSSAIPTYQLCRLARERVTVALSGDGGDENFAGYRRYKWHMNEEKLRSSLPLSLRRPLFGTLGRIYPKADWAPRFLRGKSTFQSLARTSVEAYMHSVSIAKEDQRRHLFSTELNRELQGYRTVETFHHYARKAATDDPLSLIQYIDLKTYLPGDILTKVDRASMAHSLEVRVPFLDHKFVEWVSGIPPSFKLKGQETKYLLKKAFEPYLPHDVLYRQKMGFGVPLARWFRGPLKETLKASITEGGLSNTGLFNQSYLEKLVNQHLSGVRDHSALLWTLLMFEGATKNDEITLA